MLDSRTMHLAREEWFEKGEVTERFSARMRPEILASWRRSAAFGAQVSVPTLPYNPDLDAASRLVDAAEPVLRSLAERLAGLHAGVLLADRSANIVQRWVADHSILGELDRICSASGFGAPEDRVGTNGIGTVAELRRPQMVVGAEHYADALVGFTCVGAPIRNPTTNRLEGIITLSCRADAANELLTPLMVGTASDIENRLLESSSLAERMLLDEYMIAKRRTRLIAAVNRDVLMADPRVSRELDRLVDRDMLWEFAADAVGAQGTERMMALLDGGEVPVSFSPVHHRERLVGVLIDLSRMACQPTTSKLPVASVPPAPVINVPGASAKWTSLLASAANYAAQRVPIAVRGPAGVGKSTLARALIGDEWCAQSSVEVDCAELMVETRRALLAHQDLSSLGVLLLRHIEMLDAERIAIVQDMLDRLASSAWVVLTAGPELEPMHERLIARTGAVRLTVPALCERPEDVPVIARALLDKQPNGARTHFTQDALHELRRAAWPGNVRQLEDVVRTVATSRIGAISAADLPAEVRSSVVRPGLSALEQLECQAIINALRDTGGNKVVAAQMVGISRSTIYRKIRAYGLDADATFF